MVHTVRKRWTLRCASIVRSRRCSISCKRRWDWQIRSSRSQPIPEHAGTIGLGGARIKTADLLAAIRAGIKAHYNRDGKSPDPTADYIYKFDDNGWARDGFMNGSIYFNYTALERDGVNAEEL